jgi:hypothetical protein
MSLPVRRGAACRLFTADRHVPDRPVGEQIGIVIGSADADAIRAPSHSVRPIADSGLFRVQSPPSRRQLSRALAVS